MHVLRPLFVLAALVLPAMASDAPPAPGDAIGIEPAFVRPLVGIATGRNDANPIWTPGGEVLAFERARGDDKEIVIARLDGAIVQTIHYKPEPAPGQSQFFFPGVVEKTSYNAGISWSPRGDRFVFMSNAGEGNYDLYLREAAGKTLRLTDDKEKDGHAHWSPTQDRIAFISGRSGKGDVYLLDLATAKTPAVTTALTRGEKPYLYPQWSPDGRRLAVIRGSNENHDVVVLEPGRHPPLPPKVLTTWRYDDLRPTWSADGKRIAFYTNHNRAGDPKVWAIAVVAADGSDPTEGDGLAARIVATDVIADVERGPAWLPDSRRIVYARAEKQSYYPIHVVDVDSRQSTLVQSGTTINHDITSSRTGVIAFRAQVEQWDQIFVMKLKE
jgi:Tol biopolymer transport system component